jgi:DNA-binding response OmpR family regulator
MDQSQILLVDDDEALLGALTEFVRAEGYLAQPASSGDVALVLLQQWVPFRLLITDIVLPGLLDGFALARRAREFCPSIPVIYTTGHPQVAQIRAQGAPFGEVLVKPYRVKTLLMAVSTALGKRHEREWDVVSSSSTPRGSPEVSSMLPMRRDSPHDHTPRRSVLMTASPHANLSTNARATLMSTKWETPACRSD